MAFRCASAPALPQLVASGPEDGKAEVPSREDPAQASRDRLDAGGVGRMSLRQSTIMTRKIR